MGAALQTTDIMGAEWCGDYCMSRPDDLEWQVVLARTANLPDQLTQQHTALVLKNRQLTLKQDNKQNKHWNHHVSTMDY